MGQTLTIAHDTDGDAVSKVALLFVALECERPLARPVRIALDSRDVVTVGRGPERRVVTGPSSREARVEIPDGHLSRDHARLSCLAGQWYVEDLGSKNGTRVRGASVTRAPLADGDIVELGHTFLLFRRVDAVGPCAKDLDASDLDDEAPGLATFSLAYEAQIEMLRRIAASGVPVLIQAESGTGKELVARAVHQLSGRRGSFVGVNCGALVETLVQSELFGHRRGSFSGATEDRVGLVRGAHGGTLFLDEIGDMPASAQAVLLRVLQEREVKPVGAIESVPVDLRVVSATHRDLTALVQAGSFRHDLLARLSGFVFRAPPLRERREDLGLLTAILLSRHAPSGAVPQLTRAAAFALLAHDWPLNVRQLEQALASAVILAAGEPIDRCHLPADLDGSASAAPPHRAHARATDPRPEHRAAGATTGPSDGGSRSPRVRPRAGRTTEELSDQDRVLRDRLEELLRLHHGNVAAVAGAMGKDRKQIHRWIHRLAIEVGRFRP